MEMSTRIKCGRGV